MGKIVMKLDEIMQERGMTALQVAKVTGVGYQTVLHIQKGRKDRIGLDTLAKICDALGVTPVDLLEYHPGETAG